MLLCIAFVLFVLVLDATDGEGCGNPGGTVQPPNAQIKRDTLTPTLFVDIVVIAFAYDIAFVVVAPWIHHDAPFVPVDAKDGGRHDGFPPRLGVLPEILDGEPDSLGFIVGVVLDGRWRSSSNNGGWCWCCFLLPFVLSPLLLWRLFVSFRGRSRCPLSRQWR